MSSLPVESVFQQDFPARDRGLTVAFVDLLDKFTRS
jgi:hypothetical protein